MNSPEQQALLKEDLEGMGGRRSKFSPKLSDLLASSRALCAHRRRFIGEPGAQDPRVIIDFALLDMEATGLRFVILPQTTFVSSDYAPILREYEGECDQDIKLTVEYLRLWDERAGLYALTMHTPKSRADDEAYVAREKHILNGMTVSFFFWMFILFLTIVGVQKAWVWWFAKA